MSSPQVKKVLATLLRDPDNARCADCKVSSHPRWCSWSLGVFVCIKCAGIHRSLGTHISKVKSVDLDTWQEQHLQQVIRWGNNKRANLYYEAKLQGSHTPDPSKLQSFIRTKYELKKWCGKADEVLSATETTTAPNPVAETAPPALVREVSTGIPATTAPPVTTSSTSSSCSSSLLDLNLTPVASSMQQRVTHTHSYSTRPELKKSILSLYAKPKATQSAPSLRDTSTAAAATSAAPLNGNYSNSNAWNSSNNSSDLALEDNELFKNVWS